MDLNEFRRILSDCLHPDASFEKYVDELNKFFIESNDLLNNILLADSIERRSLLTIFEQFIQLDWQRNHFKKLSHYLINQISTTLLPIADRIKFANDKIWFGGVSRISTYSLVCSQPDPKTTKSNTINKSSTDEDHSERRQNCISYFSVCILLLGLSERIIDVMSIEQVELFFQRLESEFCSSSVLFIDALIENDERCLRTLIALLKMNYSDFIATCSLPEMINPSNLLLLLLHKIHFDPLVVIDWIYSEPELCYIFLKSYSHMFSQFSSKQLLEICNKIKQFSKNEETGFNIIRAEPDSIPDLLTSKQSNFQFEIEELHGEQKVIKKITIPVNDNYQICKQPKDDIADGKNLLDLFSSFCVNLELKMNKLAKSLNFSTTNICKNLSTIESIISESNNL